MTTDEKVDKIYARVYNGLSENVAETRKDVKELSGKVDALILEWTQFISSRELTCPVAQRDRKKYVMRKTDMKYYLTTAIAVAAVVIAAVL